jgi:hypothetical protein
MTDIGAKSCFFNKMRGSHFFRRGCNKYVEKKFFEVVFSPFMERSNGQPKGHRLF